MIGNTFLDYLKIRISIAALRLVAPASVAYLVCCAVKPAFLIPPIAAFAVLETSFYFLVYLPRSWLLQAPSAHSPPILTRQQREVIFRKGLESGINDTTIDSPYPTGWFLPKNSKPKRDDVVDWLLWALFSTSREESNVDEYEEELDQYIKAIEEMLGEKFPNGHSRDEGIRSMRVHFDAVVMLHRPLVWYFIVGLVDAYTSVVLASLGFKHFAPRESKWSRTFPPRPVLTLLSNRAPEGVVFPYWYRPHKSNTKLPFIFFHGIGIGLYPYIPFFRGIIKTDPDVGILLPELMPICMHMTPRTVPARPLMLASLNTILESFNELPDLLQQDNEDNDPRQPLLAHSNGPDSYQSPTSRVTGWNRVVLTGHSYGTFVCGWALRQIIDVAALEGPADSDPARFAKKIAHTILVDPIPILLSNPSVAHNFLYRDPWMVCPRRLGSILLDADDDVETGPIPVKPISKHGASPFYSSAAAWQLWYFASRDADIARTLFRTFFWTEGGIWREEIASYLLGQHHEPAGSGLSDSSGKGRNLAVVLGGMDQIVPSEAVRRYLTREEKRKEHWIGRTEERDGEIDITPSTNDDAGSKVGKLEVIYNHTLDHAKIFDDTDMTVPLVDVVHRYIRDI